MPSKKGATKATASKATAKSAQSKEKRSQKSEQQVQEDGDAALLMENQTAQRMNVSQESLESPDQGRKSSGVKTSGQNEPHGMLVEELLQAHMALKGMKQRDENTTELSSDLLTITSRLASSDILDATVQRIRWLAAKCFADVLFLHAPDAPFEDATLKRVYNILVEALQGLGNESATEAGQAAQHVLSRMSMCKLGCILVDLPESLPGDGGIRTSELVVRMFDTVLDTIAPSHTSEVERNAVELLVGYLDEGTEESYPTAVMDSLLKRLLPEQRKESHRAYDVAREVIARCAERLRAPITNMLNAMLFGEFEKFDLMQDLEQSNVKDGVYTVLLELFRIDPNLLLHVLPRVESLLEIDDADLRLKAVKLLSEVFLEIRNDDLLIQYDKLLQSLIHRILDKSPSIRVALLQFAGKCVSSSTCPEHLRRALLTAPVGSDTTTTLLEAGLHDMEKSIRAEVVEIVALVLSEPSTNENSEEWRQVLGRGLSGRLHDVSVDIAIRAMEGLAWSYAKLPSAMEWVPGVVLGDESRRDDPNDYIRIDETRIALIDHALLATRDDKGGFEARISEFFALFQCLTTPRSKVNFFRCCFTLRKKARDLAFEALNQRRAKRKVAEVNQEILTFLTKEPELWKLMWNVSDNKVFERWGELLDPLASRKALNEARRDLVERMGASLKSQNVDSERITKCKTLVKTICRWAGMWTLCSDELCSSSFMAKTHEHQAHEVLGRFVSNFPGSFQRGDTIEALALLTLDEEALRMVACIASNVDLQQYTTSSGTQLKVQLLAIAIPPESTFGSTSRVVKKSGQTLKSLKCRKLAVRSLIKLFLPSSERDILDDDATEVLQSLVKSRSSWSAGDLYVLLTVARLVPSFELEESVIRSCVERVKKPFSGTKVSDEEIGVKVAGLKLITEFLLQAFRRPSLSESSTVLCKSSVLMLRSFVQDLGDPWAGQASRAKGIVSSVIWPPEESSHFTELRLVSAVALMKIEAEHPKVPLLVEGEGEAAQLRRQTRRMIERSRLAFDPSQELRERFLNKLISIELDRGLNFHRNGALLSIIASMHQGSSSTNRAAGDLRQLIKHLAQKAESFKLVDESRAVLSAPELIVPFLVFFLAHHPTFPSGEAEFGAFLKENQGWLTAPIVAFFDALTETHKKSQNRTDSSVGFMLAILGEIRKRRDVLDDHHGIHCVGDLVRLVIQEQIKYSPSALEPFRGKTPIPRFYAEFPKSLAAPRTPADDNGAPVAAPSPISYIPAGFELNVSTTKKRTRTVSSAKKRRMVSRDRKEESASSPMPTPARTQPRRSARPSQSFAEVASSSDDDYSSDD